MSSKRPADDEVDTPPKRHRAFQNASFKPGKGANSAMDQTYGQRGAFGSLEDMTTVPTGDSDLDCEDDAEAMAYLRLVR